MEVICDACEKIFEYKGGKAHYKRSKHHYCSTHCQNVIHGMCRRINKDKRYKIWESAKKRAKKDHIPFTLSPKDIPDIPLKCPVLGINIVANTKSGPIDSSPSIDRIQPELGYVLGNVRIICNRANRLRSDASIEELKLLIKDLEKIDENIHNKTME